MGDKKVWKDLEKHLYNSKVDEYGNVRKETSIDPNWTPPVEPLVLYNSLQFFTAVQLEQKVHAGYFQHIICSINPNWDDLLISDIYMPMC